jgi:tetratricopeptide (TPR) repeat protein
MKKTFLLAIALSFTVSFVTAQAAYDIYLDFNGAILKNKPSLALELGERILAGAEMLPAKTQINFYYKLAKVYEDTDQPEKAIVYYEKVSQAEPDFDVAHRALGYLYLSASNMMGKKLSTFVHNSKVYETYFIQYRSVTKQCLKHLEKAQACDPDDETLATIKRLYNNIKETENLKTLSLRLKMLSGHCLSLLTDE